MLRTLEDVAAGRHELLRPQAVLTEAQGCEDFPWEAMLSCTTAEADRVLAVGNPLAPAGRFWLANRARSGWHVIQISAEHHPNLREGRTVISGGPSRAWADRIATDYGRDSGVYRSRVLGEFPEQAEDALIRRSWIEASNERWEAEHESAQGETVLAVDAARYGPDETVCAAMRGPIVLAVHSWHGADIMESAEKVRRLAEQYGLMPGPGGGRNIAPLTFGPATRWWDDDCPRPQRARGKIVVDVVGLGAGVADRLAEWRYRVEDYNAGKPAVDPSRFANR